MFDFFSDLGDWASDAFDGSWLDKGLESVGIGGGDSIYGDVAGSDSLPWNVAEDGGSWLGDASKILSTVSSGAKVLGQASDLFTSSADRAAAQQPTFATRDINLQLEDMDAVRAWIDSNTNSTQIPTRRLSAAEANDPIFASKAINNMQEFYDGMGIPNQPSGDFSGGGQNALTGGASQVVNSASGAPTVEAVKQPDGSFDASLPTWRNQDTTGMIDYIDPNTGLSTSEEAEYFRQQYAGTEYEQFASWTPYNEEQDLDYIRRLTGDDSATALVGWNPETKEYTSTTDFGAQVKLSGEEGYRAAEDAAISDFIKRQQAEVLGDVGADSLVGKYGITGKAAQSYGLTPAGFDGAKYDSFANLPTITGADSNMVNAFGGGAYNRRAAIEALMAGDTDTVRSMSHAAHYDPTPSFLDKYGLAIATLPFSYGLGTALSAAGAAAGLGSTASSALSSVGKYALKQGVGASQG